MNRKRIFSISIPIIVFFCNIGYAQNKDISNFLIKFYNEYAEVWSLRVTPDVLKLKLDSLYEKYCSKEYIPILKEHGLEYDLITDDWWLDTQAAKTLRITKDLSLKDIYIVSYITDVYPISPIEPVAYQITLRVHVIQENGMYKINNVQGDGSPLSETGTNVSNTE